MLYLAGLAEYLAEYDLWTGFPLILGLACCAIDKAEVDAIDVHL